MLENATKLNRDFLINNCNYDTTLKTEEEKNLFDDYYLKTCQYVNEHHFSHPDIATIEQVLGGGYFPTDRNYSIICSVSDVELRKHIFKLAMAKQLIYDLENGRASMQRTDQQFSVCPEFVKNLTMLGFIRSGMFSRAGQ